MDGYTLSRDVQELLNEDSTSGFIDSRTTYDYLYEAASQFAEATEIIKKSTTITTTASTTTYNLPYNFLNLYMRDSNKKPFLKLYNGTDYYWLYWKDYDEIYYSNNTDTVDIPYNFTIVQNETLVSNITGSTTANGAATNGLSTLTDSSAPFSNVTIGDFVYNSTDGSSGVVTTVTSTSALVTALFGGTNNDWTSSDSYGVLPKARFQLLLDPPPSTSSYTIYIPYVASPDPVYSSYSRYNLPAEYRFTLAKYAAWLYKYRDREPNFGDAWYKYYDLQVRKAKHSFLKTMNKTKFSVSLRKQ